MSNWIELTAGEPAPNRKCPECGSDTMLTNTGERVCTKTKRRNCDYRDPATLGAIETTIVEELDHKAEG